MKKKMRKFADGGFSAAQEEYLGGADRTDPYILARMRSAVPDEKMNKPVLEETSEDLDPYGAANKKPISVEKTVVKTKVTPASKSDWDDNSKMLPGHEKSKIDKNWDDNKTPLPTKPKSDALKNLKKDIGTGSLPKSFTAAGGNTKVVKSKGNIPSMSISMPDPLANFDSKGKRYSGRDTDDRRKGGAIKMAKGGSASKRADGIAIRGKTKGRMV